MTLVEVLVAVLAVWRVTHLVVREDGPWKVVARAREAAGNSALGRMMDCFLCTSAWVALPPALLVGRTGWERLLLWPALSGGAILLERIPSRDGAPAPIQEAVWQEDPDPESPVLRPEAAPPAPGHGRPGDRVRPTESPGDGLRPPDLPGVGR